MEFFNKKEDVIDLELTPYGEYLLLNGEFKPAQYAFFDDEILYDGKYARPEFTELQNDIKDRIKEVPRLKTQYTFQNTDLPKLSWPDDATEACINTGECDPIQHPPSYIKQYTLSLPLGNCSFDSEYAPSWDIKFLYNAITGSSVSYLTASMHPYLQIPQIDVKIEYKTVAKSLNKDPETSEHNINKSTDLRLKEFDELHENPPVYSDGYYDFQEDFVTLEINEHNVPFLKENFDIEVFEVDSHVVAEGNATLEAVGAFLKSLSFTKNPSSVNEKGLLKSEEENIKSIEEDLKMKLTPLDSSFVEHFFNVYVDHEIDKDLICKLKPAAKQKGHFVADPLDCLQEPEVNILSSDIYKEATETTPECD
jgi:hypothetical protein